MKKIIAKIMEWFKNQKLNYGEVKTCGENLGEIIGVIIDGIRNSFNRDGVLWHMGDNDMGELIKQLEIRLRCEKKLLSTPANMLEIRVITSYYNPLANFGCASLYISYNEYTGRYIVTVYIASQL